MKESSFRCHVLFVAAALLLSLQARASDEVIAGPITNSANGHVYYLLNQQNWLDSEAEAQSLGGHLVTINDAAEQVWVYSTFSAYGGVYRALWIGLNDRQNESVFKWTSGEPVTYQNWSYGEPNGGVNENTVHMWSPNQPSIASYWNDIGESSTSLGSGPTFATLHGVVEVVYYTITTQPLSQTVNAGDNASFSVGVSDAGAHLQWRFNGTNLVGQTSATLTLNAVGTNQAGVYDVVVSGGNSLLSAPAELIVPLPGQPGSKKWQFTYGGGIATTPALANDGTVIIAANDHLLALAPSGSLLWDLPLADLLYASPTLAADGTIYVGAWGGNTFYAVNPNGALRWETNLAGWFTFASSIADDGTIIVPLGGELTSTDLYALNTDGTPRWSFDAGGRPTVAVVAHDGTIYVGSHDTSGYFALHPDGTTKWSFPTISNPQGTPAIGSDGTVYVGSSFDKRLRALRPDGTLRWEYLADAGVVSGVAVGEDGTVYFVTVWDGKLHAVTKDGSAKWVHALGDITYTAPVVSKHGTIYTSANDKRVIAINSDGTRQWEFVTGSGDIHPYEGRRPNTVIAPDGTIYFPTTLPDGRGVLYAIQGDSGPAESSWPMFHRDAQHTGRVPFAITNQSQDQVVLAGTNVAFEVGVASTQPCTFQWRHNGANMPDQTNAALMLANVEKTNEGTYSCFVSNRSGGFVSYNALLTVLYPPVITLQPTNQFVLAGSNVVLTVSAIGTQPLSYQWALNETNLSGETNYTLNLPNVSGLNAGFYTLIVTNVTGSITSTPALLDVRYSLAYGDGERMLGSNYTFIGSVELEFWSVFPNANIFYTLDGSEPSFASDYYGGPFNVNHDATLRVIAYSADFLQAAEAPPIYLTIIPTYAVNFIASGGGAVTVDPPAGPYVSGTVVTLTAQPSNGWTFLEWRGDASGANPTLAVTMQRAKNVQALFGTTLGTTVAGNGTVDVYPALPLYPYGTVARLTAIPQAGNYFAVWGNAASGNTNPLYFTVSSAAPTVSSLFAALGASQHALTVIPDGFGTVAVTPRANFYATGANVSLDAIPDPGQEFLAWGGDAIGTNNPLPVSMTTSKTIAATFTRKPSFVVDSPFGGFFEDGFRLTLTGEFGGCAAC